MFNSGLFPGGGNGNGVTAKEKESRRVGWQVRDRCSKLRYNTCEHETVRTVYFWWDVRTVCSRKPGIFESDEARRLASERPLFVRVKQLDILSETLGHFPAVLVAIAMNVVDETSGQFAKPSTFKKDDVRRLVSLRPLFETGSKTERRYSRRDTETHTDMNHESMRPLFILNQTSRRFAARTLVLLTRWGEMCGER